MTLTSWEEPAGFVVPAPPETVVRLPPLDELADKWPVIAAMLERATRRTGCYEPIDVLQLAMAGRFGIWVCEQDSRVLAAVVSEIVQYPRKRVLQMHFAGGTQMSLWLDELLRVLDRHARQSGCDHLAMTGRRGWVRACNGEFAGDVVGVRPLRD